MLIGKFYPSEKDIYQDIIQASVTTSMSGFWSSAYKMEKEAENNNFPIIGRLVGIFLETMQELSMQNRYSNLVVGMVILHIGLLKQ